MSHIEYLLSMIAELREWFATQNCTEAPHPVVCAVRTQIYDFERMVCEAFNHGTAMVEIGI